MTVITAAYSEVHQHYAMACDTLHLSGYTKVHTSDDNHKMVQHKDNLIGFSGAVLNRLAVTAAIKEADVCFENVSLIYASMLRVHEILKTKHFLTPQATREEPFEDNDLRMLICNPHGIFCVGSDRNVLRHNDYWAVGAGMHYALGAMHSYTNDPDSATHIGDLVKRGVQAACAYSDSCALPVISKIEKIERSDDDEKKENQGGTT